jgi:sucrose-6-phosphate hydrolase SacC (GH32 family)
MKKLILILFAVAATMACTNREPEVFMFSYFMGNGEDGLHLAYSEDGLTWNALNDNKSFLTPTAGKDKLMRDPCIIRGADGKFHMVWTVSWNEQGIGYASSPDLINWSEQKYIPVMEHEAETKNCWAPEVYYDKPTKQYVIFWASTIPGRFPETDTLGDNGSNHRMYYTTTKDFENFSDTKLFYDQGFNVIDATIIRENNKYYMFVKDETRWPEPRKDIRIATADKVVGPYTQASEPITIDWVEGPTLARTERGWILYYDMYTRRRMGALLSSDLQNWTDITEEIKFPRGTRHGSAFTVKVSELKKIREQFPVAAE